MTATIEDVAAVIERLDSDPIALEIEDALIETTTAGPKQAHDLVSDALDVGAIEEYETNQGYDALRTNIDEQTGEDTDSSETTPTLEAGETVSSPEAASVESWFEADFQNTNSKTWAPAQVERAQWMCRTEGKAPYAPWADSDAPVECGRDHEDREGTVRCSTCDHAAGYKWGSDGSQEHVHADFETAREWAEKHPDLAPELAFIQRDTDPFLFVDGDDVRDPETDEVHPEFISLLEKLGISYADISLSATGVHAVYHGDIPLDGVPQAKFAIDTEPFGANEDVPEVEIYPNKHVCIATGEHVPGSGTQINPVDTDALRDILETNGFDDHEPTSASGETTGFDDRGAISASADIDISNHTPDATTSGETTDDIKDVLAALDRLDAQRVAGDTIVHRWNEAANTSGENRAFAPTWGPDANGTANIVNHEIWQDTGGNGYGGGDVMAAIDCPDLPSYDENTQPRDLTGADWFRALEHLREFGYEIPELQTNYAGEGEFTSMLPAGVRDLTTDKKPSVLSLDETRRRTVDEIKDAFRTSDRCYIEALPGSGKSFGAVKAAAECDEAVTILANRGHKEQYQQFTKWAAERDLSVKQLPSFARDCPTANGTHGDAWRDRVRQWYSNGATPKTIHKYANAVIESDHGLPCCESGTCEYSQKWDFEPEDYDVLLGHYTHGYRPKVTTGRAVVIDEFVNGSFETELKGDDLQGAVNHWLSKQQHNDAIRFNSYTDLIENRKPAQCHCETSTDCSHINEKRTDAIRWFIEGDVERSETLADTSDAHAAAPLAVFTLLTASPVGDSDSNPAKCDLSSTDLRKDLRQNFDEGSESSVERTTWHDGDRIGIFDPEMTAGDSTKTVGGVSILAPPAFTNASSLVALDGTPTGELWELALNEDLNRRQVLADNERRDYIQNALGINIIQTTSHIKPYNCSDHVATQKDAALLDAIESKHGEAAGVITTSTAKQAYRRADIDVSMGDCRHYGNVKGSNAFRSKRVGCVIGSNHYGDAFIRKWAAFAGEVATRNDAKGAALSYGEFGNKVLQHMREHDTLQALFRFGRDGEGATVYVHTATLPDWVPLAGSGRVVKTWSDGMRSVISAVEDLQSATVSQIAGHQAVDIGARQIFDHVETLRDKGVLSRARDDADGRRFVWFDSNLSRIDDHGEVELPTTSVDDLDNEEVDELARNSIYTCEFMHSAADDTMTGGESGSTPQQTTAAPIEAVDTGEPPG